MGIRRLGKVKMATHYCRRMAFGEELHWLEGITVLRVEENFLENTVTFIGYCELFDPVPEGEMIPEYTLTCTDGVVSINKST